MTLKPTRIRAVGAAVLTAVLCLTAACGDGGGREPTRPVADQGTASASAPASASPDPGGTATPDGDGDDARDGGSPSAPATTGRPAAGGDTPEGASYGTELLTHLKATPHGGRVVKIRVSASYEEYKVTLETDLGKDEEDETAARETAGKLLTETGQWAEDHPALWIGSIEILDAKRSALDFRLGAERDDRKAAADAYAAELLAHLHTTPEGPRIDQVRMTRDHDGEYDIAVNTDLPTHPPGDFSMESVETLGIADRVVISAQTWIRDHPGFTVAALRVYDAEKGMVTIKVVD